MSSEESDAESETNSRTTESQLSEEGNLPDLQQHKDLQEYARRQSEELKSLKEGNARLEGRLDELSITRGQQQEIQKLATQLSSNTPEKNAWRDKIDEFKKSDDSLKGLTDDQAIAIMKSQGAEPEYEYPVSSSGARGANNRDKPRKTALTESDKEEVMARCLMFTRGNKDRAEIMYKKQIAKEGNG